MPTFSSVPSESQSASRNTLTYATKIARLLYENTEFFNFVERYAFKLELLNKGSWTRDKLNEWIDAESDTLNRLYPTKNEEICSLVAFANKGADICDKEQSYNCFRGLLAEKFAFQHYATEFGQKNVFPGHTLTCNGTKVEYKAPTQSQESGDYNCESVDILFLSPQKIICTEVKLNPNRFLIRNVKLFDIIATCLRLHNVSHKLYCYSWGNIKILEKNIQELLSSQNIVIPASNLSCCVNAQILDIKNIN